MNVLSLLFGGLAIGGLLLVLAGIVLFVQGRSLSRSTRYSLPLVAVGLAATVVAVILGQSIVSVQPQEVAVVFNALTGTLQPPRRSGTLVLLPFLEQATLYPISQQSYTMAGRLDEGARQGDDAVEARTSDGQQIRIDMTVLFSIDPDNPL